MKASKRAFSASSKSSPIYNALSKNVDIIFSNNRLGDPRVRSNSVSVTGSVGTFNLHQTTASNALGICNRALTTPIEVNQIEPHYEKWYDPRGCSPRRCVAGQINTPTRVEYLFMGATLT